MDEVTVSTLPHPISTFFIGFMLFGGVFIYFELKKVLFELNSTKDEITQLKQNFKDMETRYDNKVTEISKKIDSRVDKAFINLRNKQ